MPRLIVVLVGLFCLSCSSSTPTAQNPEAAIEEAAPWETISVNGETYVRSMAKSTATQQDAVITISIPVTVSGGNLIYSDTVTIGDRTYTANCGDLPSTSSDDVGNTLSTAHTLTVPTPTSVDKGAFWRSSMYQLTRGDVDVFRLRVTGSRTIDLAVMAGPPDSTTDTYGQLLNSSGLVLDENDDSSTSPPHFIVFGRVSPGTYYVKVRGARTSTVGSYSLLVGTWRVAAGKPVASGREQQMMEWLGR